MIPKIIHYVWVGDNPKPKAVMDCIESWKKYCPDWQIIEWGNEALFEIDNLYAMQAFENKKWAFVSDFLRLWVLYEYGGFYFDTDLELTNEIDEFLDYDYVTGFEKYKETYHPITAFWGAVPHNKLIGDLLDEYNEITFVSDGKMDLTTNVQRVERYLRSKGIIQQQCSGIESIIIPNNGIICPYFYFCCPKEGEKNYSIHHYEGSWVDGYSRKVVCSLGNYRLIRFRRRKNIVRDDFAILNDEKIIASIDFNFLKRKVKICLCKVGQK